MNARDRYEELAPWTPFDLWASMHADGLRRAEAAAEELARRNATTLDQADTAITEVARFGADSIGVVRQISEEWLRASCAAARWLELWFSMLTGAHGSAPDQRESRS